MAQSFYGSICLDDLGKVLTGKDGKEYLCLSEIPAAARNTGKNGKNYLNIQEWINDEQDQFGNIASILLQLPKGEPKKYIGNLKRSGAAAPAPVPTTPTSPNDDLPF